MSGVLQRVSRFVSGDADGGGGLALINLGAEPQHARTGVVVIRQPTLGDFHSNVVAASIVQNVSGGGRPAELGVNLHPAMVCRFDAPLSPEHQNQSGRNENQVTRIKKHGCSPLSEQSLRARSTELGND